MSVDKCSRFCLLSSAATRLFCWLYLALILALWGLLRGYGDVLWFPTVLLFGPRWPYALPLIVLVPAAILCCVKGRRSESRDQASGVRRPTLVFRLPASVLYPLKSPLFPLILSALVLIFPLMGFTIPWQRALKSPGVETVRIATCNLAGEQAALANILQDSRRLAVDVICLQECPPEVSPKWAEGWNIVRQGQVAIASTHPIADVQLFRREHPPSPWPPVIAVAAVVRLPDRDLRVCSVHLTTPRPAISQVLDRRTFVAPSRHRELVEDVAVRREESRALTAWLDTLPDLDAVAGDFNMPTQSAILREYWAPRYTNAFSAVGFGLGHTKHTPVGPFTYGLRIDQIFISHTNTPIRCQVGVTVGSDHLPVWADLAVARQSPNQ